ncbi:MULTISPECIES: hypothetical protein [Mesonia]|uniref:Uncharacterized protein n=1 Tax=Mesonia oceanica TaxID=2687242 RepID=A0AC61YE34_9FLAO|nr:MULTISPECIES: hypothetical protein [Mesonia]MAN27088.1 hypothetical protein [Mesonia sp.]MAQ41975.1 hypothetical protein [Mesonia sp.]MBJ97670.1 hypothetical protein [Flavobacteriaceae bacterium]VVV02075.1 hypothetical protein FVB9532_03371 [Mesonia oceanica]|tara:strand:- start:2369 stop:2773 length:405 start_codon:yes stop_codon:yes gene_type:complete
MKPHFPFLVFFCFTSLCIGQPRYAFYKEHKKERVYDIYKIDSTKNYYLAQALMQKDSVLLVIDKQSVQLKNKKINRLEKYTFKTHTLYDIISPSNAIYCQYVDHQKVWCEEEHQGLHFTDNMGDEYWDDDSKKE